MLAQKTYQKILGIDEEVQMTPLEMADKMNVTFFPIIQKEVTEEVKGFAQLLQNTFAELKVNIVPYEKALEKLSYSKIVRNLVKLFLNNIFYWSRAMFGMSQIHVYFNIQSFKYALNRVKIKKGISVVCIGEQKLEDLPMKYIYSFKDNSIITILDFPKAIETDSSFDEHYKISMDLFVHNMTNIVIGVDKEKWILYNFNASHPVYSLETNFKENILQSLVPKVVAPIRPYKLKEFIIKEHAFNINDSFHKPFAEQIVRGAEKFGKTNLYPKGRKIDDLPFRNSFSKWIGKLHLDHRNGMSFGFLAHQLPVQVPFIEKTTITTDEFFVRDSRWFISFMIGSEKYELAIPDVWVLTQKSGSNKTSVNPETDLIKIGLSKGQMIIETQGNIDSTYKPSFDTKVILAHALGNAIIASILKTINPGNNFSKRIETKGISLSHWHGYIHPDFVPEGFFVHGKKNPQVACSSPQSALYAMSGKLETFLNTVESKKEYIGDIHIEPQHGVNVNYHSLEELADYLVNNPEASVLGNKYYNLL